MQACTPSAGEMEELASEVKVILSYVEIWG